MGLKFNLDKQDIKCGLGMGGVLAILTNLVNIQQRAMSGLLDTVTETTIVIIGLFALAFGFGAWCFLSNFFMNHENSITKSRKCPEDSK